MGSQPSAFGDLLRQYRMRAGLTQEELASRVGLAATTISALERGTRRKPYPYTRQLLADTLTLSDDERVAFLTRRPVTLEPSVSPPSMPTPRTRLIGREREIDALCDLFAQGDVRLVTLTGVGGTGKTRLALGALADPRLAAGDAVFVELAPLADPARLPQAIATAIGLHEVPDVSLQDTLASALQRRPVLLVLDNCEHLIDACAELADWLLTTCPVLRILATSREPLRISGEQQWRVSPLAAPHIDQNHSLADIATYPAVQLFLARVHAVLPDFQLTPENAEDIAHICTRLGGLPLALELAAVRLTALSPRQLLGRLDDAIRVLTGGSRAGPTRQQTLRAALDWSYNLLTAAERAVFTRLAVFAGGCDLDAAEAVCAGGSIAPDEVFDPLARLIEKSLVLLERDDIGARYRLLEPVRQYALDRLIANGDDAPTRDRHARYFRVMAERMAPALQGPEQLDQFERLERDQENLRAALRHAIDQDSVEQALCLALALAPFWEGRSQLSEGRQWIESLLACPSAGALQPDIRARALLAAGRLAQWQAQLDDADHLLTEALSLAEMLNDCALVAESLAFLGAVRRRQGRFEASAELLVQSLESYRATDDNHGIAVALLTLGVTERYQHAYDRSVEHLEESLARFRRAGDLRWIAMTLGMLGSSLLSQGNLARSASCLHEALLLQHAVGDRAFSVYSLMDLAILLSTARQPLPAARVLGAMLALVEQVGVPLTRVSVDVTEQIVDSLRDQLAPSELDQALCAGRALTIDGALAELARAGQLPEASPSGITATAAPAAPGR